MNIHFHLRGHWKYRRSTYLLNDWVIVQKKMVEALQDNNLLVGG